MKRALSGAWLTPLRILLVALLTQPAAAALFHDTAARYPLAAGVIAAVEGAIIAYHSKSSNGSTAPDEYAELGRIFSEYLDGKTPATDQFKNNLKTALGDATIPAPPDPPKATG